MKLFPEWLKRLLLAVFVISATGTVGDASFIVRLFIATWAVYVLAFWLPQRAVHQFYNRLLAGVHEEALDSIMNFVEYGTQVAPRPKLGRGIRCKDGRST